MAEAPLRFARPTVEGEEPERERGGVFMDIIVGLENHCRDRADGRRDAVLEVMLHRIS